MIDFRRTLARGDLLGVSSPQLVGREIEIDRLTGALTAVEESRPTVILIIGEAGVGKTRLARAVAKGASERGMHVLRGECVELAGGEFPYAPIAAALRDLSPTVLEEALRTLPTQSQVELARVFPDVVKDPGLAAPRDEQFAQTRVFAWLLSLFRSLSEAAPLLLAVDDLQSADASSRDFFRYLVRSLRSERIGVIVTVRSDELHRDHPVRRLVAELIASEHVERMDVPRLPLEAVERQLAGILEADPPPELVSRLFARAEGNPFYTEELLAADRSSVDTVPSTLRDTLLLRVESRSEHAQAVARLISAVRRPAEDTLIEAAASLARRELRAALRECVDYQLLVSDPESGRFRFRHSLLRDAVYQDLLPAERAGLHRDIAHALEAARGQISAAECAYHWDAGDEPARALKWFIEAGSAAQRVFAHREATAHFSRALELWPIVDFVDIDEVGTDLVGLQARAAETARWTGNPARAKELCELALQGFDHAADPMRAAALYERLGRYQAWNVEGSLAAYELALALLPEESVAERVRLQVNRAYALTFLGRWEEAKVTAQDALERAAGKQLLEEGSATAVLGVAVAFLGDPVAGSRHLRRAVQLAERAGNIQDLGQIQLDLGEVLRLQGQIEGALKVMLDGERLSALHGTDGLYGNFMAVNAADDLFRLGRWDEAEAKIRELERHQLTPTAELLLVTVAGRLNGARGDFESAVKLLERGVELTREAALLEFIPTLRAAYAELELWRNATERARQQIAAGLESVGESADALHLPALYAMGARAEADGAEEARLLGDTINAEQASQVAAGYYERLAALLNAARSTVTPPEAEAHLASSHAELARASGLSSPDRWARVVELWRALDRPYATAYAGYRHAEALVVGTVRRSQAEQALAEAARLASSLSAQPLLARIRTLGRAARLNLAAVGLADVPPGPVADTTAALDLTERELQVLSLLAAGLTNREIAQKLFISQRTAGVHVSHILSKLGVPNRVMAAAAAQRLGLPPMS